MFSVATGLIVLDLVVTANVEAMGIMSYRDLALILLTAIIWRWIDAERQSVTIFMVCCRDHPGSCTVGFTAATPSKRDQRDQTKLCIRAPPLLSSGLIPGLFKKSRGGLNIRMSSRWHVFDATDIETIPHTRLDDVGTTFEDI